MDDLFDYGDEAIGKPTGIDIKEKKMTLPLIYALHRADTETKRKIIYIIKNQNTNKQKVAEVIAFVKVSGGIAYAQQKMLDYQQEAREILHSYPASQMRDAMEELMNYVVNRKH
jgi:octaprenyl-diphosphate synthase